MLKRPFLFGTPGANFDETPCVCRMSSCKECESVGSGPRWRLGASRADRKAFRMVVNMDRNALVQGFFQHIFDLALLASLEEGIPTCTILFSLALVQQLGPNLTHMRRRLPNMALDLHAWSDFRATLVRDQFRTHLGRFRRMLPE